MQAFPLCTHDFFQSWAHGQHQVVLQKMKPFLSVAKPLKVVLPTTLARAYWRGMRLWKSLTSVQRMFSSLTVSILLCQQR